MDLTALHHFYWVVREGNFSKAARALKIAQPAISRAVIRLEDSLGEKLLLRDNRKVELTPLGNSVFLECQVIFEAVHRVDEFRKDQKREISGPLRIAAGDSIAEHLLPAPIAKFVGLHPEVYPAVTVGTSRSLAAKIAANELDFGLFFHVDFSPSDPVEVRKFRSVPFRLVVLAREAKNPRVLQSFIGSREVDSPDTRTYPTLEKLRKKHAKAAIRFSTNHLALHKRLVLEGVGVSVLPEFLVRRELEKKVLRDVLPGEKLSFDLKIVTHKQRPLGPAAREFLEFISDGSRFGVGE